MNDTKSKSFGILADLARSTSAEKIEQLKDHLMHALVPLMVEVCNKHQTHDNGEHAVDVLFNMLVSMDIELMEALDRTVHFTVRTDSTHVMDVLRWFTHAETYQDFEARQFGRGDLWSISFCGTGHTISDVARMCRKNDATFSMGIE